MRRSFLNLYYWILDYIYVARYFSLSSIDHESAERYRNENKEPVLLIPGVYENWHFMKPIAKSLYEAGYDIHVINELGNNRGDIEKMAEIVHKYILAHNLTHFVLVTHSKGGLIGKYLLSTYNKNESIKGLIALNAPFSGSRYAYLLPIRSLRIFTPTSPALLALSKDRIVNKKIISIYGKFDPHIPGGSNLEGAQNIQLETYGHFRPLNDPRVHREIIKAISDNEL